MRRWVLLICVVLVPLFAIGQVVVMPSGWATSGQAGPVTPGYQPLVVTPEITFRTVSPSPVGATNTTANNIAGATNATVTPPVVNATQTAVEYVVPAPSMVGSGSSYDTTPIAVANLPTATPSLQMFNRGAAQFASAYNVGVPQSSVSLGEIARELREQKSALNARTYTNEDINRINQQLGPAGGGISTAAIGAGTSTQTTGSSQSAPVEPASGIAAPAQAPPQNTPPRQQQAAAQYQPPQQPETQAQSQESQPQSQPSQQQSQSAAAGSSNQSGMAQGTSESNLPGTASPLPGLTLLALIALSVGFIVRGIEHSRGR